MANFDLYAACNAMATRLASVTPPTGETMRAAFGQAPNNAPALPAAVVEPQSGDLILEPGAYQGTHAIDVVLLIEKSSVDYKRIETRRQKWLPVIYHAFDGQMALGLAPIVKKVKPIGWEFVEYSYAGTSYDSILVHFSLDSFETVSLVP